MAEYKLSYTAAEINEKLNNMSTLTENDVENVVEKYMTENPVSTGVTVKTWSAEDFEV